jgi:hypothetical protein
MIPSSDRRSAILLAQIVDEGIKLQASLGTAEAARYMRTGHVPTAVMVRVLAKEARKRAMELYAEQRDPQNN